MACRCSLAHSTVSFSSYSHQQITDFGQETWTIPPSGRVLRAQVHHNCSLHFGNVDAPPSHPAIEGRDDRRRKQVASVHFALASGHPGQRHLEPEQNVVVSRTLHRETNHPAMNTQGWAVYSPPT